MSEGVTCRCGTDTYTHCKQGRLAVAYHDDQGLSTTVITMMDDKKIIIVYLVCKDLDDDSSSSSKM